MLLCGYVALELAQAEPVAGPVTETAIGGSSRLPRVIAHRMLQGAKSCFWGTLHPTPSAPRYGVHLFQTVAQQKSHQGKYTLDISEARSSGGVFVPLQRVTVDYPAQIPRGVDFSAAWTWLEPQRQRGFVLRFTIKDPDGFFGTIGDDVFVSFPEGLNSAANVQSLPCGTWSASDVGGQDSKFLVGPDGVLQIRSHMYAATIGITPEEEDRNFKFTLMWDSQRRKFWPDAHGLQVIRNFYYMNSIFKTW
jgi:hypothetical protein